MSLYPVDNTFKKLMLKSLLSADYDYHFILEKNVYMVITETQKCRFCAKISSFERRKLFNIF